MSLLTLARLAPVLAIPAAWYAARALRRRVHAAHTAHADALIAANAASWRPGMEKADQQRIDRVGERRWQEAVRAKRRTYRNGRPEGERVVAMRG